MVIAGNTYLFAYLLGYGIGEFCPCFLRLLYQFLKIELSLQSREIFSLVFRKIRTLSVRLFSANMLLSLADMSLIISRLFARSSLIPREELKSCKLRMDRLFKIHRDFCFAEFRCNWAETTVSSTANVSRFWRVYSL